MTDLLDAIDDLTKPQRQKFMQDTVDGGTVMVSASQPSLLEQLNAAIRSSMGASSGAALKSEGSILNTAALFEAIKINTAIREWCRMVDIRWTEKPWDDLRAWHVATLAHPLHPDAEKFRIGEMRKWANRITGMLDPPRERELDDACPMCEASTFWRAGAEYKRPLVVRYRSTDGQELVDNARAMCRSCEAVWGARELSRELEIKAGAV